jgi:hypothetical protein
MGGTVSGSRFAAGGLPLAVCRWLRVRSFAVLVAGTGRKMGPTGRMGPMGTAAPKRQLQTATLQRPTANPKKAGPLGCSSRAACVSRLATLFAGHPRTGSLCSMGPPHRVDWRLSRPVLIIFAGEVSEKCARIHEFYFSLDSPVADDLRPTTDQGCSRR